MNKEIRKIEINENGIKRTYDVLFTVSDDKTNHDIVFYTDLSTDMDVFAALYDKSTKTLKYVSDPNERERLSKLYETVTKSIAESE